MLTVQKKQDQNMIKKLLFPRSKDMKLFYHPVFPYFFLRIRSITQNVVDIITGKGRGIIA